MFTGVGGTVLSVFEYFGRLVLLARDTLVSFWRRPFRRDLYLMQIVEIGARSQLVVLVTGAFTGAVFAAQTFFQFHRLGMDSAVGAVVSVSMFRELGPVLTALMLSGRVGAAIAAEIGTMKVTEQVDALRAMGVDPVDYLVVPRVAALISSAPILVAECVGVAVTAGYLVAVRVLGVSHAYYVTNMLKFTTGRDIKMALVKGFAFALVIGFIACDQGLRARNGAAGVGRAPTEAVVISSLVVLVANFFLSFALNIIFPA